MHSCSLISRWSSGTVSTSCNSRRIWIGVHVPEWSPSPQNFELPRKTIASLVPLGKLIIATETSPRRGTNSFFATDGFQSCFVGRKILQSASDSLQVGFMSRRLLLVEVLNLRMECCKNYNKTNKVNKTEPKRTMIKQATTTTKKKTRTKKHAQRNKTNTKDQKHQKKKKKQKTKGKSTKSTSTSKNDKTTITRAHEPDSGPN